MDEQLLHQKTPRPAGRRVGMWILAVLSVLVLLLALRQRPAASDPFREIAGTTSPPASAASAPPARPFARKGQSIRSVGGGLPAEQVVSNKVAQFARSRREIAEALAQRANVEVPAQAKAFFDALDAGNWEAADALFKSWKWSRENAEIWTVVKEAYGAAEVAHAWPAQKLLDYGEAVLGSLQPGMVYIGGTDAGRFIPTLLNETSGGEKHVVLTQNALADGTYLDYARFLYGDRLNILSTEESEQAFSEYMKDAQERLKNGQLRPGEDVRMIENRFQASGQVAVMAINEILLQKLLAKNPDVSFALEESFSLKSTYTDAAPLGPILELRATSDQAPLTRERAQQAVEYWKASVQDLADEAPASDVRKAYAQMAQAQGNFLAEHNFSAEAEQAYRIATELSPVSFDSVSGLYRLLTSTGRANEAEQLLNGFARTNPEQHKAVERLRTTVSTAGR